MHPNPVHEHQWAVVYYKILSLDHYTIWHLEKQDKFWYLFNI